MSKQKIPCKFFISYARANKTIASKLLALLEPKFKLSKNYLYEIWKDDNNILPGDNWHDEIQKALEECDFGIMMLSEEFFVSTYIKENELPHLLAKNKTIPVALKPLDFSLYDLAGVEAKHCFFYKERSFDEYRQKKGEFAKSLFVQIENKLNINKSNGNVASAFQSAYLTENNNNTLEPAAGQAETLENLNVPEDIAQEVELVKEGIVKVFENDEENPVLAELASKLHLHTNVKLVVDYIVEAMIRDREEEVKKYIKRLVNALKSCCANTENITKRRSMIKTVEMILSWVLRLSLKPGSKQKFKTFLQNIHGTYNLNFKLKDSISIAFNSIIDDDQIPSINHFDVAQKNYEGSNEWYKNQGPKINKDENIDSLILQIKKKLWGIAFVKDSKIPDKFGYVENNHLNSRLGISKEDGVPIFISVGESDSDPLKGDDGAKIYRKLKRDIPNFVAVYLYQDGESIIAPSEFDLIGWLRVFYEFKEEVAMEEEEKQNSKVDEQTSGENIDKTQKKADKDATTIIINNHGNMGNAVFGDDAVVESKLDVVNLDSKHGREELLNLIEEVKNNLRSLRDIKRDNNPDNDKIDEFFSGVEQNIAEFKKVGNDIKEHKQGDDSTGLIEKTGNVLDKTKQTVEKIEGISKNAMEVSEKIIPLLSKVAAFLGL